MVRTRDKKPKGDETFQKRTQKVGRKKLAPATSTRAEVASRGLRVGVSKSIIEAQSESATNKQKNNNNIETFSGDSQNPTLSQYQKGQSGNNQQQQQQKIPDITTVLVAINHYKAGSRAQALKNGVTWVRSGKTATESPSLTIQLLTSSLGALSDTDSATRDAAAAVISAIDQCVLIPSNSWSAVAEPVCDRLNICLTHGNIGVRTSAVQLLSELSSADKHDTQSKLKNSFLSYLCTDAEVAGSFSAHKTGSGTASTLGVSGAASSSSSTAAFASSSTISTITKNAMNAALNYADGSKIAGGAKNVNKQNQQQQQQIDHEDIPIGDGEVSRYEAHDENIRNLLRNAILVVKTKPVSHFPLLPCILNTAIGLLGTDSDSSSSSSLFSDSSSSNINSSTDSANTFASRNHSFLLDCLNEVWDFGCIRVKEQFETTVALFRNEQSLKMVTGILDSTSILISVIASQIQRQQQQQQSGATDLTFNNNNNNNNTLSNGSLFPRKQLLSDIIHMVTTRVPFSMEELCSARTTSPRKVQLATSLGRIYLSLLQTHEAVQDSLLASSSSSSNNRSQFTSAFVGDDAAAVTGAPQKSNKKSGPNKTKSANQFLPVSEIKGIIKRSLHQILGFGLDFTSCVQNNINNNTETALSFPEITAFAFSCLGSSNSIVSQLVRKSQQQQKNNNHLLSSLPKWMMHILTILDNNQEQDKILNKTNEETISNILALIQDVTFSCSFDDSSEQQQGEDSDDDSDDDSDKDNNKNRQKKKSSTTTTSANINEINKIVLQCWEKIIQFHFMLRGSANNTANNNNNNKTHSQQHQTARRALIRHTIRMMYEFVTTVCRDVSLQNSLIRPNSASWVNVFASMSTIIAMIRQQQQEGEEMTETVHLGSSFLPSLMMMSGASTSHQQEEDHETRVLAFGVLHFAGFCLRNLNEAVPSSWEVLMKSSQLKKTLQSNFHPLVASEYIRLLNRVLI